MELSYILKSGYLEVDKKIFVKYILLGRSILKEFISNNRTPWAVDPEVVKEDKVVKVIFDKSKDIKLKNNYEELFIDLKSRLGNKLKGKLAFRVDCHLSYYSVIDLNGKGVKFY